PVVGKNRKVVLLVYNLLPTLDVLNYKPSMEDNINFIQYFHKDIKQLEQDIDSTIATNIVGRSLAKTALALGLHSPLELNIGGKVEVATLKIIFFGDTSTGKTEILRSIDEEIGIPQYVVAEIASRSGIVAGVDKDNKIVRRGILPQNDCGYVGLDGIHGLQGVEIKEMREVLRSGIAMVMKIVQGGALARVRIVATANLKNSRGMDDVLYKCQAIKRSEIFSDPVDIPRWDIWVPFVSSDVSDEDKAKAEYHPPAIPYDIFRKHVFWAWTLRAEDIVFSEEVKKAIEDAYLSLIKYKSNSIPIIHDGYKFVLYKLSASFAILTHNVNEDGKVAVEKKHVEYAVDFVMKLVKLWQLEEYIGKETERKSLSPEELEEIEDKLSLEPKAREALELISKEQMSLEELAEHFNLAPEYFSSSIGYLLRNLGLAESKSGRQGGYEVTDKGIAYLRLRKEAKENMAKNGNRYYYLCKTCFEPLLDKTNFVETEELSICNTCGRVILKGYKKEKVKQN
ncbi:MAG: hypothetical protein ACPLZG_10365, partial [Thermoproteota archaeon]